MQDKLDFIFNLTNKLSPQIEKILREVESLRNATSKFNKTGLGGNYSGIGRFNTELKNSRTTMSSLHATLKRLEAGRDNAWRTDHIEKYNRMIEKVRGNITKVNSLYGHNKESGSSGGGMFGGQIGSLIGAGLGVGLGMKAFDFGKEAALTGAKYEKYNAIYENAMGSKDAARNRMSDMKGFASNTPFAMSDLVASDIKLQNRNQNLSIGKLTNLGDLAASQGKGFDQLTEALLDAQTGEFERLKEFGIKANKVGDNIKLNFKNQTISVKNNSDAITEALIGMGKWPGVAGSMAKISKTTEGAISNLGDSYEQMMAAIGQSESGPVKDLIAGLGGVTNTVKKWFEIPVSETLRKENGEMDALVAVAQDYTKSSDERNAALQKLQETYPEYFSNLSEEDVKLGKLQKTLDGINASYEKKIGLASSKETRRDNLEYLNEAKSNKLKYDVLLSQYDKSQNGDKSAGTAFEKGLSIWDEAKRAIAPEEFRNYLQRKSERLGSDISIYSSRESMNADNEKLAQLDVYLEKYKGKYETFLAGLNEKSAYKFKSLYADFAISESNGTSDNMSWSLTGNKDKKDWIGKALADAQRMDDLLSGKDKKSGSTGNTALYSGTSAKSDSIIGGGAKPVNINVNINTMNGVANLTSTSSVKETSNQIGDAVMEVMLRAINGAVMMTGNNVR